MIESMGPEQRRRELGAVLRLRRESLRPEDLGLRPGGRRRSRGLRREEVAMLAGMSISWYTWLEQGRDIRPSAESIWKLAQALQLSDEEWCYVSLLASLTASDKARLKCSEELTIDSMQKTLDAFTATPAIFYNSCFDILAANAAARAFYGHDVASANRWERNMVWRFFRDQDRRRMYPDDRWDPGIRNLIGAVRMNWAADLNDGAVSELVDELRHVSSEFDSIWRERALARLSTVRGRIRPLRRSEAIAVQYTRLCIPEVPGYVVAVLIPANPESAVALERQLNWVG
jgi:transcriptional regulator with XRE-family HTH domain